MSKRKQRVRFLMVTMHYEAPHKLEPFRMLLPVKAIKQIRVFKRNDDFNIEAHTVSDVAYYVVTAYETAGLADCALGQLMDYLNGI